MSKASDHKLRRLLSQSHQQRPSPHFTEGVMREIEAMEADCVRADVDLLIMLKKGRVGAPSVTFTHSVLQKIREPQPTLYKPVIGANFWKLAAALIVAIVAAGLTSQSTGDVAFFSNPFAESLGDMLAAFNETLLYFVMISFSGGLLLWLDHYFNRTLKADSH